MRGDSKSILDQESAARILAQNEELGLFNPPANYAFEPEFADPPPRTITARAREGHFERQRTRLLNLLLGIGLVCLAGGEIPIVMRWAKFIVPLQYLTWIGLGAILIWAVGCVERAALPGPYRYLKRGIPLVARVIELFQAPGLQVGELLYYRFKALVEYRDPHSGELQYRRLLSPLFLAEEKEYCTTSFSVGDYVTAVYLPGKYPKSLQLVGFLDLLPDTGLAPRLPPIGARRDWKEHLIPAAFVAWLAAIFTNFYVMPMYDPVDLGFRAAIWPMLPGGLLAALAMGGVWLYRRQRRAEVNGDAALANGETIESNVNSKWNWRTPYRWAKQLYRVGAIILLGCLSSLAWSIRANAWLDESRAKLTTVEILARRVKTEGHFFRHYIVEYRLPGDRESHWHYTTPERLDSFVNPFGAAELHEGRFGWRWVKTLHPTPPGK